MKISTRVGALSLALALIGGTAQAGLSESELARLGQDLTPLGAERAGNAAGTIPEWTNEMVPVPPGFKGAGQHHPNPFADDQVLFQITNENKDQYRDNLTPGQIGLLETYPDTFKMNVYQTRRTATFEDWYYENTKKVAAVAELAPGGNGVENVGGPDAKGGIPFPIPSEGVEVIWNHLLRYQGVYRVAEYDQITPSVQGRYVTDRIVHYDYYPFYDMNWDGNPNTLIIFAAAQLAPPKVAGDAFLFYDYTNPEVNPRKVWRYFAGQRRVRRAPVFVYDTPIPPSYGYRTIDNFDMFFGSTDKYEWELKGKQEIYIPYNSYELTDPKHSVRDLAMPGHVRQDVVRYELHRTWVVEATIKDGERHIYPRRTFYVDEDSWNISIIDQYDERDNIWRVIFNHLKNYYDVPITYTGVEVHHDLISRRYNSLPWTNDDDKTWDFTQTPPPVSFFTPEAVRRIGTR